MFGRIINLLRSDGSIVVNKALARNIGLTGAALYSELASKYIYFSNNGTLYDNSYFYCTIEDLEYSTSLSRNEQDAAIRKLVALGLIEKKVMKTSRDNAPKRYFKIIEDEMLVLSLLSENIGNPPDNRAEENFRDEFRFAENQQNGRQAVPMDNGRGLNCENTDDQGMSDDNGQPETGSVGTHRMVDSIQIAVDSKDYRLDSSEKGETVLLKTGSRFAEIQQNEMHKNNKSICEKPAPNNTNINNTNIKTNQSVGMGEGGGLTDEIEELESIKERCQLHLILDVKRRTWVENCLDTMYYSSFLQVGKARFPQNMVRSRMHQLHGSIIFYALDKLKTSTVNTEKVTNSTCYFLSCIFNSIVEYVGDPEVDPQLNRILYHDAVP